MLSRARGALLGVAIGDALGAPVEFMTPGEISSKHGLLKEMVGGGWLRLRPGQVTDDTEMSLCIARALVAAKGWDLAGIANNFAAWLKKKPVDVGDTCRRGIRNFMLKGELETPYNQWDAGNGALMRMAPVALFTLGDDNMLARRSLEQARITHNHPFSDAACQCYGRLLHLAIYGAEKSRLRKEADLLAGTHTTFCFDPYHGLSTGYVVDTMQTVCHHFFSGRDFEECVVGGVNQGGDADTAGAIIGGLAGAYYGLESIPKRWLKRLDREVANELTDLADKLLLLSPLLSQKA
jgi:ADP-ribosyl-[dinitrogen reductase] hydrolase